MSLVSVVAVIPFDVAHESNKLIAPRQHTQALTVPACFRNSLREVVFIKNNFAVKVMAFLCEELFIQ